MLWLRVRGALRACVCPFRHACKLQMGTESGIALGFGIWRCHVLMDLVPLPQAPLLGVGWVELKLGQLALVQHPRPQSPLPVVEPVLL